MKSEDERKWFDFHGIQPELAELYRYFDRTVLCYRIIIAVLLGIIAILERDMATLSAEERAKIVNELNRVAVGYLGYQKEKTA